MISNSKGMIKKITARRGMGRPSNGYSFIFFMAKIMAVGARIKNIAPKTYNPTKFA